jgi:hypothetical protein
MPVTIADADIYLEQTDRWEAWSELGDEDKQRTLNMAYLKLQSSYPCLKSFEDWHVFLQAAYMRTDDYSASQSNVASMSASMTGVSVSWARTKAVQRSDGLDPLLLGLIGDPAIVCPQHGKVKRGRVL